MHIRERLIPLSSNTIGVPRYTLSQRFNNITLWFEFHLMLLIIARRVR